MAPLPTLSVVIPTRDSRELTLACLASLPAGGGVEVLVVDDASRDGTADAVDKRFPGARVLRSERTLGFAAAANRGMAEAGGELLLALNSDTEVDPGSLDRLRQAFVSRPRLGIAGAVLRYPDGGPQWSGGPAPTLPWLFALASDLPRLAAAVPGYRRLLRPPVPKPQGVAWVTGAAMAVRRAAWRDHGPFDEGYRLYCQDLDFCLQARAGGWEVAVLEGFSVLHHGGATIAGLPGALSHGQHPELLWTDLVRWATRHHGRGWARAAVGALRTGTRLRLAARAARLPFVPAHRQTRFLRDSEALRRAVAALAGLPAPAGTAGSAQPERPPRAPR